MSTSTGLFYSVSMDVSEHSQNLTALLSYEESASVPYTPRAAICSCERGGAMRAFPAAGFQIPLSSNMFRSRLGNPVPFLMCSGFHSPSPLSSFFRELFLTISLEMPVFTFSNSIRFWLNWRGRFPLQSQLDGGLLDHRQSTVRHCCPSDWLIHTPPLSCHPHVYIYLHLSTVCTVEPGW